MVKWWLLLLFAATAQAQMTELRVPGPVTGAYRWQCAPTGFLNACLVGGVCIERYYAPGRYIQPKIVGAWQASWDFEGNPIVDQSVPAPWPGCYGTGSVVLIGGIPMFYITTDANGNELVENACRSYLVAP